MRGGVIDRPAVIAEASLVALLADRDLPGLVAIPRARRRGRWAAIDADGVAEALADAGSDAVVAARSALADPGAAALAALTGWPGAAAGPVLRLPDDRRAAAWVVGWTVRLWRPGAGRADALRAVQVVAGSGGGGHRGGADRAWPPRAEVMERWARRRWRPCRHCADGGASGGRCGGCGVSMPEPAPC